MRGDTGFPVRVRYAKRGKIRWISHRDVARAFERALRIEQLPLAFTLGFSPRPKVSFGLALSTGHESEVEYLDLVFSEEIETGSRESCCQLGMERCDRGLLVQERNDDGDETRARRREGQSVRAGGHKVRPQGTAGPGRLQRGRHRQML